MITTSNTPNLPGWLDLGSPDPAASAAFYRKVFGWTSEAAAGDEQNEDMGEYLLLSKDGKVVAGLGGLQSAKEQSEWTVYVRVPDIDAAAQTAASLGGAVRAPAMKVGSEGSLAQLTDATGAKFALWQPGEFTGFGRACEDDSLLWIELYTRDTAAAKRFYGEVFGWQTEAYSMPEGAYDMWTTNPGVGTDAFGGMMQISPDMPIQTELWVPYFMVADTDATIARALEAGGEVLMPAVDAPPGRLAALTDQFGAHFNLLKPAPM
ncbi:VOC family protein [Actinospica durhamensis]|uniref:VOC family protein n=1 Tax=Actinospica durhamensis TaxID=1508375 RepID=A0A941ESU6_9ACTN|nr:VOC family protein [Actinospica durhamensis]MBR7836905.1 VOC family protein [Actinospica durhamensis]